MNDKMQPPPDIRRDLIPDNAYLLKKSFEDIRKHEICASQPHAKQDKTYDIMRQRGQISGLPEALERYKASSILKNNYKIGSTDIAQKLGVQTYQFPSRKTSLTDYGAAMTLDAQRPSYISPANPTRYSRGLDDELLNYEL